MGRRSCACGRRLGVSVGDPKSARSPCTGHPRKLHRSWASALAIASTTSLTPTRTSNSPYDGVAACGRHPLDCAARPSPRALGKCQWARRRMRQTYLVVDVSVVRARAACLRRRAWRGVGCVGALGYARGIAASRLSRCKICMRPNADLISFPNSLASPLWGLNPRPYAYEAHALPAELKRLEYCARRCLEALPIWAMLLRASADWRPGRLQPSLATKPHALRPLLLELRCQRRLAPLPMAHPSMLSTQGRREKDAPRGLP